MRWLVVMCVGTCHRLGIILAANASKCATLREELYGNNIANQVSTMRTLLAACLGLFCLAGQSVKAQDAGSIQGRVTDASGAPVYGALVVVEGGGGVRRTTVTDGEGAFQVSSLPSGDHAVRVTASGLSDWSASNVPSTATAEAKLLEAIMQVAPQVTTITVGLPPDEVDTV